MQAELVSTARSIGVAMGSRFHGAALGFTTDEAKATACAEAGLQVTGCYNATGPRGWEVVAHADPPEAVEDTEATKGTEA